MVILSRFQNVGITDRDAAPYAGRLSGFGFDFEARCISESSSDALLQRTESARGPEEFEESPSSAGMTENP